MQSVSKYFQKKMLLDICFALEFVKIECKRKEKSLLFNSS